ncbi:hypothetical protein Vi05172_g8443 [Venturia inaequalis]|nr:hypothetical protein Vi05172_g8443 [Venturia inaequalis]
MVTTRGGADTASNIASSPATLKPLKKRPAEATEGDQDSPSLTKRKRTAKADTKSESPVISKKIAVRSRLVAETPATPALDPTENPKEESTPALPPRNHIRFNSASPPPAIEAPAIAHESAVVEEAAEESDDDAAPEEVSLSTAKAQSRAVEEKVVKELSESAKRKRRRRDARLKAQAEGSIKRKEKKEKKKPNTALEALEEADNEDGEQSVEKLSKSAKQKQRRKQREKMEGKKEDKMEEPTVSLLDEIPDLLPEELLATEAPIRLPTPPPSSKVGLSKDAKTFEPFAAMNIPRESAPKDLTYNNLSVRVLGTKNALLPPKATSRSKSIRDTWLKGRSAFAKTSSRRDTGGKLQRRPMGGATKAFI